jgi:hypothetical protein
MTWRKARRRRKKTISIQHQIFFGVLALLILVGLSYGVWYGSHHERFSITDISVSGGATVSHTKVRDVVWETLTGDQYLLVSKKFAYLYPEKAIQKHVSQIPRVHDVSVTREGTRLSVSFEEYVPYALWCDAVKVSSCVFLTKDGYGFDTAPHLTGGVFVRYITETASSTPDTKAFSETEMENRSAFIGSLREDFGFKIVAVVITEEGDELYHLARGGIIMTSTNERPLEKIHTVLSSEEFSHLRTEAFNYIDLRFGNRVFVNEE